MKSVFNCYNPKIIRNPYTHQTNVCACGHCNACVNIRVSSWVTRLDMEASCHKYTLFTTLTYNDLNIPQIVRYNDTSYIDSETAEYFDISEIQASFDQKERRFIQETKVLDRLDKSDFQKFIKRLRYYFTQVDKSAHLRYFLCGEYGPRTFRPHGHLLLFFDSDEVARQVEILLSKSWTFGDVYDPHFVSGSASKYVSSYVNSVSKLPKVYLHERLRPFTLCSKQPAIGTLVPAIKEVRELVSSGDNKVRVFDASTNSFRYVPLWRSLESRLYPRCQCFSSLTSNERITLYRLFEEFEPCLSAEQIACRIKYEYIDSNRDTFLSRYFRFISYKYKTSVRFLKNLDELTGFKGLPFAPSEPVAVPFSALPCESKEFRFTSLVAFARTLKRFHAQREILGLSIKDYLSKIENYYDKKSFTRLADYFTFQDDYFKTHPLWHLVYFDLEFYKKVTTTDWTLLSKETKKFMMYLYTNKSLPFEFTYDISCGVNTRNIHLSFPSVSSLPSYKGFKSLQDKIAHDLIKQKTNNSYALMKKNRAKFKNVINYYYG